MRSNDSGRELQKKDFSDNTKKSSFDPYTKLAQEKTHSPEMTEEKHYSPTAQGFVSAFTDTLIQRGIVSQEPKRSSDNTTKTSQDISIESPSSPDYKIEKNKYIRHIWEDHIVSDIKSFVAKAKNHYFWNEMEEQQEFFKDAGLPVTRMKYVEKKDWFGSSYGEYQEVPNEFRQERTPDDYKRAARALKKAYSSFRNTDWRKLGKLEQKVSEFWMTNREKLESFPNKIWRTETAKEDEHNPTEKIQYQGHITRTLHSLVDTLKTCQGWYGNDLNRNVGDHGESTRRPPDLGPISPDGKLLPDKDHSLKYPRNIYTKKPKETFEELLDKVIDEPNEDTFFHFRNQLNSLWALHVLSINSIEREQISISDTLETFSTSNEIADF